jgi:integrase
MIFSLLPYETEARKNEVERLEWTELDRERNKVSIRASKHSNARIVTVSKRLMDLLFSLPRKEKQYL